MVYRSPMPFARFDRDNTALDEFIQAGVETVVMLVEEGEDLKRAGQDLKTLYTEAGLKTIHYPIVDFEVPEDPAELQTVLNLVSAQIRQGKKVAIHCYAGQGRTGLFIALLGRQLLGLGGDEAIKWVRSHFKAIETHAQENVVREFVPDQSK